MFAKEPILKFNKLIFIVAALLLSFVAKAQLMNHYWGHDFNSTSSLLGGAVVAGEAGNTALYYNPATISEMANGSNISFSANLFSWGFYNFKNALGDSIDLNSSNFLVQPQFVSYSYKPKVKKLSVALGALTRVKEQMSMSYSNSDRKEILPQYPGPEVYNTEFLYKNDYSDSWVGVALSHRVNEHFSYGVSMFASFSTLKYSVGYAAYAYNDNNEEGTSSPVSEGTYFENTNFTDYRLIFKGGMAYKANRWRFGLTLTTPSMRLFSGGKLANRKEVQINIVDDQGNPRNYIIFDGQQNDSLTTNYKLPFSTAFGFIYNMPNRAQKLYFSMEFFGGLEGYNVVKAPVSQNIAAPAIYDTLTDKNWLSYTFFANPVLNVGIGYSLIVGKDLVFKNGIRTDFTSVNKKESEKYKDFNTIKTANYNIYHYSAGIEFSFKNNRLIAGGDFAFGWQKNDQQMTDFSNPVEYDPLSGRALQGPLSNTMNSNYIGFSIYLGATLNFDRKDNINRK